MTNTNGLGLSCFCMFDVVCVPFCLFVWSLSFQVFKLVCVRLMCFLLCVLRVFGLFLKRNKQTHPKKNTNKNKNKQPFLFYYCQLVVACVHVCLFVFVIFMCLNVCVFLWCVSVFMCGGVGCCVFVFGMIFLKNNKHTQNKNEKWTTTNGLFCFVVLLSCCCLCSCLCVLFVFMFVCVFVSLLLYLLKLQCVRVCCLCFVCVYCVCLFLVAVFFNCFRNTCFKRNKPTHTQKQKRKNVKIKRLVLLCFCDSVVCVHVCLSVVCISNDWFKIMCFCLMLDFDICLWESWLLCLLLPDCFSRRNKQTHTKHKHEKWQQQAACFVCSSLFCCRLCSCVFVCLFLFLFICLSCLCFFVWCVFFLFCVCGVLVVVFFVFWLLEKQNKQAHTKT